MSTEGVGVRLRYQLTRMPVNRFTGVDFETDICVGLERYVGRPIRGLIATTCAKLIAPHAHNVSHLPSCFTSPFTPKFP